MHSIELTEESITLPITQTALRLAQQFASQQLTQEKKEQVYLNTLAVCVVNDYMQIMDIPTELKASDSWNLPMRFYANVADLKLAHLGYLECRPIQACNSCYIPPEVPDARIGVVVIGLNLELEEATLLGFTSTVRPGELALNQLQTVDDLLEYLESLELKQGEVRLSQWLQNIFETGWQTVEEILAPKTPHLAFRYRGGVTRGKLVDLELQVPGQSVALVVSITPKTSIEVQIKVQVHPTSEQAYLPDNLTVKVLDGEGATVMEAHAKTANTHITLEFSTQMGARFSIRLELGDTKIAENFVV